VDRLRRVPAWAWALLFSVALTLPRLGAFGLWEPWELAIAEKARTAADELSAPKAVAMLGRAELLPLLRAIGVKIFGTSELGARLFGALSAIGALMAVYWGGVGLFRRRAALLAVLTLGATPLFALSARQVTTDMPLVAALALTLGALGRWAWPSDGRRRRSDLAIGALGLIVGHLAGGAVLGVALPTLALALAVATCRGMKVPRAWATTSVDTAGSSAAAPMVVTGDTSPADAALATGDDDRPTDGTADLAAPGSGPDVPAGQPFGVSFKRRPRDLAMVVAAGVLGLVVLLAAFTNLHAGQHTAWLGGTPHAGPPTTTFEFLIKQLGFGLFPFSVVAFFALGRPLIRIDDEPGTSTNARLAFVQTYLLLYAGLGFALSTVLVLMLGEARFVALGALGLAMGAFIDEALEGRRSEPVAGLLIATGTMVLARDFFLSPEDLASVHLLGEKLKWPPQINLGYLFLAVGAVAGGGFYAGIASRGRALGRLPASPLEGAGRWRRTLEDYLVKAGRYGLQAAVGAALVFGFCVTQVIVPLLSTHLSFKPALESYAKYAKHGERFGRYRIEGKGTAFYSGINMIDLPTPDRVAAFLRDPQRVFALVSADELGALDSSLKTAQVPYSVINAKSSRFLLLSNRLEAGEVDENPLRRNVWMAPTNPATQGGTFNPAEKPPWTWRVPVSATFGDAVEIVGATFPESLRRPGKITLELTFRVKVRPPAGYKIFVHVDGPASPRLLGDHDPVGKTFPTSDWLPGEYIRDVTDIDAPLMTTPAGTYRIFIGFWPGGDGKRLKITSGPNDGSDRLLLGSLEIK
jgi:dolichyl-phosphate-mannose-protein mannosyltransferase